MSKMYLYKIANYHFKRENIVKKVLAELGIEPGTLAFEDHCSTTELRNPSYFLGKKLLNTTIIFAKNSGPSNQLGEKALG